MSNSEKMKPQKNCTMSEGGELKKVVLEIKCKGQNQAGETGEDPEVAPLEDIGYEIR
jgi:hypothetical protein